MLLDGFTLDPDSRVDALYPDFERLRHNEPIREDILNIDTVVKGWNTFGMVEDPDF